MTPTATATLPPEPAATHTATPTASPPAPLSVSGPWALILNQEGIWAVNEDGSGLTHLTQDVVPHRTVSVSGRWIAYVTDGEAGFALDSRGGLTLKVLSLPEGTAHTVTELQIPNVTGDSSEDLQFSAEQVYRAVVFEGGGLAWSPDGSTLAFVSGHDGISADLYVVSRDLREITRLTDGPSQAYQISWSPDSRYIFHTGASNFGTGAGYMMVGVWVARADGTGVRSLYEPDPRTGAEVLVDWVAVDTALVHSWRPDCGGRNLITVNVASGEIQVVWPDYFNQVAYNPDTGAILIDAQDIGCNPEGASGLYLMEPGSTELQQVSDEEYHSQLPGLPADPVPVALEQYLGTLLEVESLIWVQP
ncbi:MAG: PD40 domain-containing protein [Anaerolineae bacterium]|nr:PD40 domain-containing protein [Anaerolineae bacterium]